MLIEMQQKEREAQQEAEWQEREAQCEAERNEREAERQLEMERIKSEREVALEWLRLVAEGRLSFDGGEGTAPRGFVLIYPTWLGCFLSSMREIQIFFFLYLRVWPMTVAGLTLRERCYSKVFL